MLRTSIPSTTSTLPAMMVSEPRTRDSGQAALMADCRSIGKDRAGPVARSRALSLDAHTTSPAGLKVLTASACPRGQLLSEPVEAHPGPTRGRIDLGSSTRCAESPVLESQGGPDGRLASARDPCGPSSSRSSRRRQPRNAPTQVSSECAYSALKRRCTPNGLARSADGRGRTAGT